MGDPALDALGGELLEARLSLLIARPERGDGVHRDLGMPARELADALLAPAEQVAVLDRDHRAGMRARAREHGIADHLPGAEIADGYPPAIDRVLRHPQAADDQHVEGRRRVALVVEHLVLGKPPAEGCAPDLIERLGGEAAEDLRAREDVQVRLPVHHRLHPLPPRVLPARPIHRLCARDSRACASGGRQPESSGSRGCCRARPARRRDAAPLPEIVLRSCGRLAE